MPRRDDLKKILIIGSGPIVIGQACEFDYSGTQACKALREEGYEVVLVNSNPATIMTDPTTADRTYIEPLTWEMVAKVIEKERPDALLPTLGGPDRPQRGDGFVAARCARKVRRRNDRRDTPNPFYAGEHLDVHVPVGLHLQPGRATSTSTSTTSRRSASVSVITLSAAEREKLEKAHALQEEHGISDLVLGHRPHGDPDPLGRPRGRAARVHDDGAVLLLGRLQHHGDELLDERHAPSRRRRRQEVAGARVHRQQHAVVSELVRRTCRCRRRTSSATSAGACTTSPSP